MSKKRFITAGGRKLGYQFINEEITTLGKPLLLFLHEGLGCIDK